MYTCKLLQWDGQILGSCSIMDILLSHVAKIVMYSFKIAMVKELCGSDIFVNTVI